MRAAELLGLGLGSWSAPEAGGRGSALAYYGPDGRLVYAGRVGTGIKLAELERLWRRLQPLAIDKMPLDTRHRPDPTALGHH